MTIGADLIEDKNWRARLAPAFEAESFTALNAFIAEREAAQATIFPPARDVFNAFNLTSFEDARVVVLGQDPYHGQGQAMGLSFSVPVGVKQPPSLRNILKEVNGDIGASQIDGGDLSPWARQGVLLLNAVLTVEQSTPGAHAKKGWESFTDFAIGALSDHRENLVFMLWGAYAQKKAELIDADKHLVLEAAHPSPFSAHRGFFGCQHFSKANAYLAEKGGKPIEW